MRYFNFLSEEEESDIFHSLPVTFDNGSDKKILAYAVGAALYMPATRITIADDLIEQKHEGLVCMVIDLEDAVGDAQIKSAEDNLYRQMTQIAVSIKNGSMMKDKLPLIFIRVRGVDQFQRILARLSDYMSHITGFVFPKFTSQNGEQYFQILSDYNRSRASNCSVIYGMPILESSEVIYLETRVGKLLEIKELLDHFKDYVLNVRLGATDFSSLFGLRRSLDMTIYDIGVIRDCIVDVINIFGRSESDYVISGPVWEYFRSERVLKSQLRQTPFEESMGRNGRLLRLKYINDYVDGLIREVVLDKENGIIGKTIIHPTQIKPVQSLYAVTHEEYVDATHIIENNNGLFGVTKSRYSNKMNEIKPHLSWAQKIMTRSLVYGVLHEHQNFTNLLTGHERATILV